MVRRKPAPAWRCCRPSAASARPAVTCGYWPIPACRAASTRWRPCSTKSRPRPTCPSCSAPTACARTRWRRCWACRCRSGPSSGSACARWLCCGRWCAAATLDRPVQSAKHDRRDPMIPNDDLHMTTFTDARIAAGVTIGALQIGAPMDAVDNRILLCHALGLTRVGLITQSERALTAQEAARLSALVTRRLRGEPIAYIVGQREFFGLPFEVTPAVLIPRPDTELLVELALEHLPPSGRVLDMGTGSGAIAVALAHTRRDARVTALDVSADALAVAARNTAANGASVRLLRSDWFAALDGAAAAHADVEAYAGVASSAANAPAGAAEAHAAANAASAAAPRATPAIFDLIVSNPPYIASGDRHLSEGDLRFEPSGALTDHADGLSALRIIVAGAARHLAPQGWLLMEHGYDQAAAVRTLLSTQGYTHVQSWRDLAGIERVTGAQAH